MVLRVISPTQTGPLPSFQELCKAACPESSEARPALHDPARGLVSPRNEYTCPVSHCTYSSPGFTTWAECVEHFQVFHGLPLGHCGFERRSERDPEHDSAYVPEPSFKPTGPYQGYQEVQEDSYDTLPEPVAMGWFDPTSERAQKVMIMIASFSCDELYHEYWMTDPRRQIYGEQPISKKTALGKSSSDTETSTARASKSKQDQRTYAHMIKERGRRLEHAELQKLLWQMTCELAHVLADRDKASDAESTKSTCSKGPGKFEQFRSDVYMHILGALVAQSEHRRRLVVERRVQELEHQLHYLRCGTAPGPLRRRYDDDDHRVDHGSPSKRPRVLSGTRRSAITWKGRLSTLPPSPSPSPSAASTCTSTSR